MSRIRHLTEAQKVVRRARSMAWQRANRERVKEIHAKHRKKNASAIRVSRVAYLRANREKKNATAKAWRAANPEKMKQYRANRNRKHPGHGTIQENKRRARKKNAAEGNQSTIAKWVQSWRSKPFARCFWCKEKHPAKTCHADHIQPLSKGGAHSIENLCISCSSCNHRKSVRTLDRWNALISEPVLL